jgi:hypothetical protein
MLQPPSTTSWVPVMKLASGDARNAAAAATSSGVPNRPATVCCTLCARSVSLTRSQARVRIGPGTRQLTRTCGPYSIAGQTHRELAIPVRDAHLVCGRDHSDRGAADKHINSAAEALGCGGDPLPVLLVGDIAADEHRAAVHQAGRH